MRMENFPTYFNIQQIPAQRASPMGQLVSMLNETSEDQSPLEAAKQALLDAKSKLDQQRDERIEAALGGYRALRSRQISYKSGLTVHQTQLENFQNLNSRYDALSEELTSAKADYQAYTATETTLDITEQNRLSLRVSSLERELASVDHDISALVGQANRYTNSQRQYADYLDKTGQAGYAAFEYQEQPEYTRENFVSAASAIVDRMETGAKEWGARVSSYCEQCGFTPSDFESYLAERHKLSDAYFAAQQKFSELLYANGVTPVASGMAELTGQARRSRDIVEISEEGKTAVLPPQINETVRDAEEVEK